VNRKIHSPWFPRTAIHESRIEDTFGLIFANFFYKLNLLKKEALYPMTAGHLVATKRRNVNANLAYQDLVTYSSFAQILRILQSLKMWGEIVAYFKWNAK